MKKKEFIDLLFLCIAFFPYVGLSNIIENEIILNILKILSLIYIFLKLLSEIESYKINVNILPLLLFSIYSIFVLIINSNISFGIIFGIIFTFFSSIFLMIKINKGNYEPLRALFILFNLSIILNFPSVIRSLSLSEYHKTFLLGGKNSLTIFCIITLFFNYLYYFMYSKKYSLFGIVSICLSILTLLLSGSSTGFIVGILVLFVMFIIKNINIKFKYYFIMYSLIFLLVINSNMISKIPFLYDLITVKMNKDLTFTGRTNIWNNVIIYIKNNLWGYGRGNSIVSSFTSTNECHNAILELLLCDGFPGLFLFLLYLFNIFKVKTSKYKAKIMNISKFIIFCIFLLGLTESIIYKIELWWILIITFSINYFEIERNNTI